MTDHTPLNAIDLSALLSSRVCHDLINPVGAIGSGLSMLDDGESDAAMKEMANALVREGTEKALALLSFARLAYGAAGGYGTEIKVEDAQAVVEDLYKTTKATLDWQVPAAMAGKNRIKILLILAASAAECIPRGGTVLIEQKHDDYHIKVTGQRLFLNDDFLTALEGQATEMKPKYTPAYLAGLLAREENGRIEAARTDEMITFTASFS